MLERLSDSRPNTLVKRIYMGDCEDPYLYAAFPLHEWESSEEGQYVMEHSRCQPVFYCDADPSTMGYVITIYADLHDQALTFYNLKYRRHK